MKKLGHILSNHWLMFQYFLKFAPAYIITQILFCIYVSFVDTLSGPAAIKYVFNGLSENKSFQELFIFLVFVSLAMMFRHIFGAVTAEYLSAMGRVKVSAGIQRLIFEQARKMDLAYYETPKFYTDFVWASSQSDEKIFQMFNSWCVFVARLSDIIFLGGFMLTTDYTLLLFAIAALVIRLIFSSKQVKKRYEMDVEIKPIERERDYISRVFYLADYAKEIRLSNMHRTLFERLKGAMSRIKAINIKGGKKLALYSLISSISTEGVLDFAMYSYLCYQTIVTKMLKIGSLASLTESTWRFTWALKQLVDISVTFGQQSLYVDNFREFLKYTPDIEYQKGIAAPQEIQPITLKNVTFHYVGEEKPSLKNINMTIHPYEKIAIVGYNGAGKSTLVKLLMRFYDVSEGEILLGQENIKNFDTNSYRQNFGAVFQDYQVFAGTIAENVVMGFVDKKDKENIKLSLEQSGFAEKLNTLPKGIDTQLTREFYEDGINLSGGEAQKVSIARIFFKNCNYVILDEPSSALDPISEYNLNKTMLEAAKNKTVIFISHRLSTTCLADKIYMLENGEIIEQGSHEELMALGGKYAEMFHMQAEKYRAGAL